MQVGDTLFRFGNVINVGTTDKENHLGEANNKTITLDTKKIENTRQKHLANHWKQSIKAL